MNTLRIKLPYEEVEEFVKITSKYDFDIDIRSFDDHYVIDAKSIMGIFSLKLSKPVIITTKESGPEVAKLFSELSRFAIK